MWIWPAGSCTLRDPRSRDTAPLASWGHIHSSAGEAAAASLGRTTAAYAPTLLQYTAGVTKVHTELPSAHEISRPCVQCVCGLAHSYTLQ